MRKVLYLLLLLTAVLLTVGTAYRDVESYCVLFPPIDREIFGVSQRNIIIYDANTISLIPQVNFEGNARDFGILVPVPARPELSSVGNAIFTEASIMTQPLVRNSDQGCGCSDTEVLSVPWNSVEDGQLVRNTKSGVTVIYEQIVGTFQAVVLQATDAGVLSRWLHDNQYSYNPADSLVLEDYVKQNWYFVAMKLDTNQVPNQINRWWNASTSPARIRFARTGNELTYPLKVSAISTREKVEVVVYTIGPDPIRFEGASVEYANEIDDVEMLAIKQQYPTLSEFLSPGTFVTKLRREFKKSEMTQDMPLRAVDDRREFRRVIYTGQAGMQFVGLLLLVILIAQRRSFWR